MTNFKEALDDFEISNRTSGHGESSSYLVLDYTNPAKHAEIIRLALKIADKLQSGEVSVEMENYIAHSHRNSVDICKAVMKNIIQECKEEKE